MIAAFHCFGTTDVARDRFNRRARGLLKTGAPSLRNQAGKWSNPEVVGRSLTAQSDNKLTHGLLLECPFLSSSTDRWAERVKIK